MGKGFSIKVQIYELSIAFLRLGELYPMETVHCMFQNEQIFVKWNNFVWNTEDGMRKGQFLSERKNFVGSDANRSGEM